MTWRRRLSFSGDNVFRGELTARVNAYFQTTGQSRRDVGAWYVKAATILVSFAVSYSLLVFVATAWWQAVPLTVLLALSVVGIGFNIMHDGSHRAISRHRTVNRLMAHWLSGSFTTTSKIYSRVRLGRIEYHDLAVQTSSCCFW